MNTPHSGLDRAGGWHLLDIWTPRSTSTGLPKLRIIKQAAPPAWCWWCPGCMWQGLPTWDVALALALEHRSKVSDCVHLVKAHGLDLVEPSTSFLAAPAPRFSVPWGRP